MKAYIIDITKCNGCYNCQLACKDEHVGNDWTPYAKPQPDTGQFWTKVEDLVRGTVPKVKVNYMHHMCQHCEEAPCITACKSKAIYKRDDGAVIIDPEKCSGQRNCLDACPYGVIYFNEDLNLAQKCTFCAHLLDNGWKEPRCVDACPTGALTFGDEKDLKDLISQAEILHSEFKTKPGYTTLACPGSFVAGAVYDPSEDKCIKDAMVTLLDSKTGEKYTALTDSFGDFWLKNVKLGTYSLKVEKKGYLPKEIKSISTEKDVNLGDIELSKKA